MADLKFLGTNFPSIARQRQADPASDRLLIDTIGPTGGVGGTLVIDPVAAVTGVNLVLDVQDGSAASLFTINGDGDVVIAGDLTVTGAAVVSGGPSSVAGSITFGDDTSDTVTLARGWIDGTDLSYASSLLIDPVGSPTFGADGTAHIVIGSGVDPTVNGTDGSYNPPSGSLLLQTNGTGWIKTGAGATSWTQLATGSGNNLQQAYDTAPNPDITQDASGGMQIDRGTSTEAYALRVQNTSGSLTADRGILEVSHVVADDGHAFAVFSGGSNNQAAVRMDYDSGSDILLMDAFGFVGTTDTASSAHSGFSWTFDQSTDDGGSGTTLQIESGQGGGGVVNPGGGGGNLQLTAGGGGSHIGGIGGGGGDVNLSGGAGGSGASGPGGAGGDVNVLGGGAGGGGSLGNGGNVLIRGGSQGTGTGVGGNVSIQAGGAGIGTNGVINIGTDTVRTPQQINSGNTTGFPTWDHRGQLSVLGDAGVNLFIVGENAGGNRFAISTSGGPSAPVMIITPGVVGTNPNQYAYISEFGDASVALQTVRTFLSEVSPESVITAPPGSIAHVRYPSADANDGLWVKQTGVGNTGWEQVVTGAASSTLQDAYEAGNTISVVAADGSVDLSNSTDTTDVLSVSRTFVGAGEGISVAMGPGNEAVTGRGVEITSGTGATGAMLFVNNLGTGDAFVVQDNSSNVIAVSATGAVDISPTPTTDFSVTTVGAGADINLSTSSDYLFMGTQGELNLTNSVNVGPVATLTRTFAGGGDALVVAMGPGAEAVTGNGVEITSGTGATGNSLFIDNQGSGNAVEIQDGSVAVFVVSGAGAVDIDPTSGQNFTVDTAGAGSISLDSAAASNFTVSGATADLTLGARGATITLNETGETTLDATFTATSIVGALNELKADNSAVVATFVSDAAITAGDVVTTSATTDGRVVPADANSGDQAIVGLSLDAAGGAGASVRVVMAGLMTGLAGLTRGSTYYLSATAGGITTTAPSTSGDLVIRIGWATSATALAVHIGEGTLV